MPQPFLPCLIPVKNVLHQIEHAKNVRICFDHNHTAPVIEPIQVPVLPQTDEAHVCTERRTRRQMIGRANVDAVPLKRFCPVKVKFRPTQCQLLTACAMQLDRLQLLLQPPIENTRAQFHGMFPSDHFSLPFSVFIICRPEAAVNGRPYHLYGSVFILFAIFSVLHKNKPYKLYDLSAYKLYGAEQKKTRSLQHFRRTVYFL